MAIFSVTADNFRLDDAEDIGGVSSRGGGAGAAAEPQLAYQGSNAWNRKVTSSTGAGFEYDPISDGKPAHDATAQGRDVWIFKAIVSDAPGLQPTNGLRAVYGSGNNEYLAVIAGTDALKAALEKYKLRTSTLIVPIALGVAAYRDPFLSGSGVNLAAMDKFGIEVAFANSQAKSENVGLDALDFGTGLIGTGGGGVDPAGNWTDYVIFDEGTIGGRYGYANSFESVIIVLFGNIRVGDGVTPVIFEGSGKGVRPDGLYPAGWSVDTFDLTVPGSVITDTSDLESLGTIDVVDTRADVVFLGNAGVANISHTRTGYRNYVMTSSVTLDGANIDVVSLTQSGGIIVDSNISCNAEAGAAVCSDADFSKITNNTWTQNKDGHAIEDTGAPGPRTVNGQVFVNFGGAGGSNSAPNSGPLDAAYYNNTGGHVDLNLAGSTTGLTIRNGVGSTTSVIDSAVLTVTGIPDGLEVRFSFGSVTMPGGYSPSTSGGTFQLGYDKVRYAGRKVTLTIGGIANDGTAYDRFEIEIELPSGNSSLPFLGSPNQSYEE